MIAMKRIRTIKNNKLVMQMPERYNNSRVEVIVLPIDDKPSFNIFDLAGKISDIDSELMNSAVSESRKLELETWQ